MSLAMRTSSLLRFIPSPRWQLLITKMLFHISARSRIWYGFFIAMASKHRFFIVESSYNTSSFSWFYSFGPFYCIQKSYDEIMIHLTRHTPYTAEENYDVTWLRQSIMNLAINYKSNFFIKAGISENDILSRVWSVIRYLYDNTKIDVHRYL